MKLKRLIDREDRFKTVIPFPALEVTYPAGKEMLPYEAKEGRYVVFSPEGRKTLGDSKMIALYEFIGKTDPGNRLELDGKPLTVAEDGTFITKMALEKGSNKFDLLITNPQGFARITSLHVDVKDSDENGKLLLLVRPIPHLTVNFPPEGKPLTSGTVDYLRKNEG